MWVEFLAFADFNVLVVVVFFFLIPRIPFGIVINCVVWLHLSSALGWILIALSKRKD